MKFEQKLISRIFAIVVLSGLTYALFSANSAPPAPQRPIPKEPELLKFDLEEIDANVDSLLVKYGIEKKRVRKKKMQVPGSEFIRIERMALIPPSVVTVLMNAEFNAMAKRYGGRALASENLKENSVTIHIEVERNIVQSLVLQYAAWAYETKEKSQKKAVTAKKVNKPIKKKKSGSHK